MPRFCLNLLDDGELAHFIHSNSEMDAPASTRKTWQFFLQTYSTTARENIGGSNPDLRGWALNWSALNTKERISASLAALNDKY